MGPSRGGSLEKVHQNRLAFVERCTFELGRVIYPAQVIVLTFGEKGNDRLIRFNGASSTHTLAHILDLKKGVRCEAAYTEKRAALLGMVADCFPVAWETDHFICLSHHGREGILSNLTHEVAEALIEAERQLGGRTIRIFTWVGPGVCQEHYEVSLALAAEFVRRYQGFPSEYVKRNQSGRVLLNLKGFLFMQLSSIPQLVKKAEEDKLEVRVTIKDDARCTVEAKDLFSDRLIRYPRELGVERKLWGRFGVLAVSE
jgi:copper oxidase (laccase) domain-containing protein